MRRVTSLITKRARAATRAIPAIIRNARHIYVRLSLSCPRTIIHGLARRSHTVSQPTTVAQESLESWGGGASYPKLGYNHYALCKISLSFARDLKISIAPKKYTYCNHLRIHKYGNHNALIIYAARCCLIYGRLLSFVFLCVQLFFST